MDRLVGGQFKFQFGISIGQLVQLQCVAKTVRYELALI
jgi:hypothetical protein